MALPLPNPKTAPKTGQPAPKPLQAQPKGTPTVGAFLIKTRLTGSTKDVAAALRSISFLEVAPEKDAVNALYVESRDLNKQPYVFSILKAGTDELELSYSIPPGMGPSRRRLDMVRYFINLLNLLEPYYEIDNKTVLQLMEASIKDVIDSVSMDYSKLYTEYDTAKKELEDLRKRVKRLSDENTALASENYELKNRGEEAMLRLKQLEKVPEEALMSRLQEWISEHNGEINVSEFAKVNSVNENRVEEALNKLITEGYIELVQ